MTLNNLDKETAVKSRSFKVGSDNISCSLAQVEVLYIHVFDLKNIEIMTYPKFI